MPALDELLQQALELDVFLRDCPKSCQKAAAFVEQAHFPTPTQDRIFETMAIFNWLSLARGIQRTMLYDTQILNEQLEKDYMDAMIKYIPPAEQKKGAIGKFIEDHPKLFDGGVLNRIELRTTPLDELINEQLDQLLYLYMSQYISGALDISGALGRLVDQGNTSFSAKDKLADALRTYQLVLMDAILQQFNIIRLIELRSQNKQSKLIVGTVGQLIEKAQHNQLSLPGIEQLRHELMDLIMLDQEISEPNPSLADSLKDPIENFITNTTDTADRDYHSELGFQATNSFNAAVTKAPLIKELYKSDRHTTLEFGLSKVFQYVMGQRLSISEKLKRQGPLTDTPLQSTGTDEIKPLKFDNPNTKDSALQALGKAVEEYDQMLSKNQTEEDKSYPNRDDQHVKNRQKAVRTLLRSVNRADELTAPLKYLGFLLIQEIKANKPTWKERSLIIKIVDILFLGIPALLRNTFFKRTLEPEMALLKASEAFPHDMKEVEATCKQKSSTNTPVISDTDSVEGEPSSEPHAPNT